MKIKWWIVLLALAPLAATLIAYPALPAQVATHWGVDGKVNGYGPKSVQIMVACLPALIYFFMQVVPKIDPKKSNYDLHGKAYQALVITLVLFLVLLNALTLAYNLGYPAPVDRAVTLGLGALFMVLGNFMGQFRHNYFVGIRTPWTLANEEVWRKTHRLCAKFYMASGLAILLSTFIGGQVSFIITIGSVLLTSAAAVLYSYWAFRKLGLK